MNKIACAIMVSLSGTCFLQGEIAPPETDWKGGRLIYDGVIIKNQINLPQKGIKYHDEDQMSYDITDTTIAMSTTLSKNPQCGREWCYKGISHIIVKYCGPIADPDDGGTLYFDQYYDHHVWFDNKKYGQWGIMFSKVYIITRIKNANIEDVKDYGVSGEDGSIFFQYVEKMLGEL
ncbi:hypothetical protein [Akkermansia sp.]|uniref:hypothetical protein n=1 Tax=Akkermansia sp. TaxID=1872421 RepID=UPI0025C6F74D|nr:hypothetical protein [Akkermansia sp.]MCC8148092.1 hypothetical protein [Akkermansia sp.]